MLGSEFHLETQNKWTSFNLAIKGSYLEGYDIIDTLFVMLKNLLRTVKLIVFLKMLYLSQDIKLLSYVVF